VAIVALVMAMTGTAVAATSMSSGDKVIKKHTLSGNRLRNHTLTGTQLNLKSLGTVPKAQTAVTANSAKVAGTANSAKVAGTATLAGTANLAKALPALVWYRLTLIDGWTDYNGGAEKRTPAYAVDAQGIVHLRGAIRQMTSGDNYFTQLPASVRPSIEIYLTVDAFNAGTARLDLSTSGQVETEDADSDSRAFTSLDGVTYALG
jgi:hypothetical protein